MNATSNSSIYKLDASVNASNVTYANHTISFSLPNTTKWSINDGLYITLDDGVLFSNSSTNSSAQTSPQFWSIKVVDSNNAAGFTATSLAGMSDTTSLRTTVNVTSSTGGTFPTVTSMPATSAMNTQTGATGYATNATVTPNILGK